MTLNGSLNSNAFITLILKSLFSKVVVESVSKILEIMNGTHQMSLKHSLDEPAARTGNAAYAMVGEHCSASLRTTSSSLMLLHARVLHVVMMRQWYVDEDIITCI